MKTPTMPIQQFHRRRMIVRLFAILASGGLAANAYSRDPWTRTNRDD
jgi:hypothetical protein